MVFEKVDSDKKIDVLLERRSAVVLSGKFRDKWTHMIPARKSDKVDGKTVKRDIRLSITFRKIKDGISIEKKPKVDKPKDDKPKVDKPKDDKPNDNKSKDDKPKASGKVYICTMKRGLARPKPDTDEKFLSLNVTSAQATENEDRRDFSPMTEIPGGYRGFWNFEHFWQSGKVHTGFDDNYIKSVWKSLKEPTRYFPISEIKKYCKKNKIAIPTKDSEIREFFMKKLTHSSWDGFDEKMDWVTSRKKVYAPLYFEYMKDKPSALKWKKLREDGKNIVVYDFDGPKDKDGNGICLEVTLETLREQINNTRFSFGHGYIVAGWLLGIRPEEYIF